MAASQRGRGRRLRAPERWRRWLPRSPTRPRRRRRRRPSPSRPSPRHARGGGGATPAPVYSLTLQPRPERHLGRIGRRQRVPREEELETCDAKLAAARPQRPPPPSPPPPPDPVSPRPRAPAQGAASFTSGERTATATATRATAISRALMTRPTPAGRMMAAVAAAAAAAQRPSPSRPTRRTTRERARDRAGIVCRVHSWDAPVSPPTATSRVVCRKPYTYTWTAIARAGRARFDPTRGPRRRPVRAVLGRGTWATVDR